MLPVFSDPAAGKVGFGILHSVAAAALILRGGFAAFEKIMNACIGLMFLSVVLTAALLTPDVPGILSGLLLPRIPRFETGGLTWTLALMGGVGGTLTILCYGYWIREKGREGERALGVCRVDLAAAYACTAIFGLAAVLIGSRVEIEGRGVGLILSMAGQLEAHLGPAGKWMFLVGAWAAMFSSLLGVWQSAPYLFADVWRLRNRIDGKREDATADESGKVNVRSRPYRVYLILLAVVPLAGLAMKFEQALKIYSLVGAFFLPLLALALLILNGRADWVGMKLRNRAGSVLGLGLTIAFFLTAFFLSIETG
jgi:Mn2+/Fe2+ NRAMP family transporter